MLPAVPPVAKTFVPQRPNVTNHPSDAVGGRPTDPLWGSAESTIFGMVSPLIQRLAAQRVAAEENARRVSGTHASALEQALGATAAPVAQSFDKAIGSSAAVNEAVANRLNNQGTTASSGLAAQLAQIGANPETAQQLAQTYRGASGAGFAHGAADLQHLIGRGAEAASYTAKLPQIARLEANRDLAQALSQQRQTFGEQETELLTGAQKSAFDLWNQMRGEKAEAASAKEQALVKAVADAEERAWKERQTLMALKATATNKAQERAFEAQLKALDRKSKEEIAAANRNLQAWKVTTQIENRPEKIAPVASAPNRPFNPDGSRNVNWHGTWQGDKPIPPKKTDKPKSPTPPSVTQRASMVQGVYNGLFKDDGTLRDRYNFAPGAVIDKRLEMDIRQKLKNAYGLKPGDRLSNELMKAVMNELHGTQRAFGGGVTWLSPYANK